MPTARFAHAASNFAILPTPNRNCWRVANEVWSWDITKLRKGQQKWTYFYLYVIIDIFRDITKLKGPAKWTYFYLYVIIDIFSRRVVGWCVADAESAALFKALFDDTIAKHPVIPGQLTLHADRGGPMKAKATAFLLPNPPHTSTNPSGKSLQDTMPTTFRVLLPQDLLCYPLHHADLGVTKSLVADRTHPTTTHSRKVTSRHECPTNLPALLRLYRRRQAVLPYVLHVV